MIFFLLIFFFTKLLQVLVGVLPDVSPLPTGITDALAYAGNTIDLFGWILPFDTLMQIVALGIGLEVTIFALRWAVWLYNKIRGSG